MCAYASESTVPKTCKWYNSMEGCKSGEQCPYLHICEHFVKGTCKFGEKCKRSHNIPEDSRTDGNQEICIYNLWGKCLYSESCRNFHGDLPYQWQYMEQSEGKWKILSPEENLKMERSYCDPQNQDHFMNLGQNVWVSVSFKTMAGTDGKDGRFFVNRLSTSSSEKSEKIKSQPLTTVWLWYWQHPTGKWKQYGDNDEGYRSDITSTEIEKVYLDNPEGQLSFSTLGHEYILDFQEMCQYNKKTKTKREVCRRPVFVDKPEADKRKKQLPEGKAAGAYMGVRAEGVAMVKAPSYWSIKSGKDIMSHYEIVEIFKDSPSTQNEYKKIEDMFNKSPPRTVRFIKSIERIENYKLWNSYVRTKSMMGLDKKSKDVGEKQLFHGTRSECIGNICRNNFDFRLHGTSSGRYSYGRGIYFATTSKIADRYTDKIEKIMFVAKVLVGDYTQGHQSYVRPPRKDESNPDSDLYDSLVDNISCPNVHVICDNSGQVYPEYVIKYEVKLESLMTRLST